VSTIVEIEAAIGTLGPAEQMQWLRDLPSLLFPGLRDIEWLQAAEPSFEFRENEEDAVYDDLSSRGAMYLVPFPFTDLSSSKQRPALVLRSDRSEPDLVVCAITSQLNDAPSGAEFLVPPQELSSWGLPKPSKVKLAKLFTLPSLP